MLKDDLIKTVNDSKVDQKKYEEQQDREYEEQMEL